MYSSYNPNFARAFTYKSALKIQVLKLNSDPEFVTQISFATECLYIVIPSATTYQ